MPIVAPPFEYCALSFLEKWVRNERRLHDEISADAPIDSIRDALATFRVSRSFPELSKKIKLVRSALLRVSGRPTRLNVVSRVDALADQFGEDFGSRNLSAASKLLWLRYRSPVVILDARSVAALCRLGRLSKPDSYASYHTAWCEEFEHRQSDVSDACRKLLKVEAFTSAWRTSTSAFRSEVTTRWFAERSFDAFLWELGE